MAIQLPHEVAMFLNFCGVPYPDINEDHVRELAGYVRTFAGDVRDAHSSATDAVKDMAAVYAGSSYQQLLSTWGGMSRDNMEILDNACGVVAAALEVAAEVITAVKTAVLAGLAALATSYATAMAASVATAGFSAALGEAFRTAARRLCKAMLETLVVYIGAEVVSKAVEPLEDVVAGMLNRFAHAVLGVPAPATPELRVEPEEVQHYAGAIEKFGDRMIGHVTDLADKLATLDFSTQAG
ncbi:hypothetical protein [Nocardia sp. NPDC051832]|uniref:WXG100-like domain-containing protein n=1 Tax=Nocardia sp. NPDC051832 TaxID=3155673 RepID=UPI00343ABCFA